MLEWLLQSRCLFSSFFLILLRMCFVFFLTPKYSSIAIFFLFFFFLFNQIFPLVKIGHLFKIWALLKILLGIKVQIFNIPVSIVTPNHRVFLWLKTNIRAYPWTWEKSLKKYSPLEMWSLSRESWRKQRSSMSQAAKKPLSHTKWDRGPLCMWTLC